MTALTIGPPRRLARKVHITRPVRRARLEQLTLRAWQEPLAQAEPCRRWDARGCAPAARLRPRPAWRAAQPVPATSPTWPREQAPRGLRTADGRAGCRRWRR